jgi:hypothetical protein
MTTANWITVLVTLVALAVTWGEVRARLKAVEKLAAKAASDVEKSRGQQGARIGGVEDRIARLEGAYGVRAPRRSTLGVGVPVTHGGDDESGAEG